MTTLGLCAFCGLPLAPDGTRTCSCAPRSNLLDVAMTAAAVSATEPRPATDRERLTRARFLLFAAARSTETES